MELTLVSNPLHRQPQTISLSKVTALIGENGAGKSSILQSIFTQKLSNNDYIDKKIVCFSSGQNEKFSNEFNRHVKRTSSEENNLQFSCFYFDKTWSSLLIFLATSLKKKGKVRQFLTNSGYAEEVDELDNTTKLKIAFRLDSQYVRQVEDALSREARGEIDTIRQTAFHRTLESFIENCIRQRYDFDTPIKKDIFEIYPENLLEISFDTERLEDDNEAINKFDPEVGFFIRACHNSVFLDREASSLLFKNTIENTPLELRDLSDGEFQILFLYAIIDLFDSEDTLFIFDEADSHLHFENVKKFWDSLKEIKGNTISTTHLLDSIYCVGVENIRILNKGKVYLPSNSNELIKRLSQLSNIKKSEFRALTYYKKIVLIDDLNDWYIFRELYKKSKQGFGFPDEHFDERFDQVAVVKVSSGWNTHNCKFAESKLSWVQNFIKFCEGLDIKTTDIFLLCDRDNLPIDGIGTEESPLKVQGIKVNTGNTLKVHVLSWRRREVKHYLLSKSALGECVAALNNHKLPQSAHIQQFHNGDYLLEQCDNGYQYLVEIKYVKKGKKIIPETKPIYNNYLASLPSDFVKNILSPFIEEVEEEPYGFSRERFQEYISHIEHSEISEDITNMYNFIIGKL
ncbi:ATP-binding protein [Vibrio cholerae]|nr:ATP-binding protein [Vibrio cholerae]